MKKKMIGLLTLCALCAGVSAQTVTVADVEALPGETVAFTLSLKDGKADTYTSLQFNAQFPATGFTTTGDYTISSKWKNASATVGDVDASGLAIVPVSSSEVISGSDVDNLFAVSFTVGSDVAVDDYDVTLSNITFGYGFTDKDIAPDVTFTVHVVNMHSVELDENSTTAPEASNGAVNVRVLRAILANEWSTICLPFAMTETQVKAAFGDDVQLGDFTGYDTTEEGGEVVGITVNFDVVATIAANHPYIIKVGDKVTEFTVDGVTIEPEDNPSVSFGYNTGKKPVVYHPKDFNGTYVADFDFYNDATSYPLFLSGNKFYYATKNTMHMKAFRAYFDFDDYLPEAAETTSRVIMNFNSEASGINDTNRETITNNRYYDLQGRRVNNSQLKKGLYIKEGKKVIK